MKVKVIVRSKWQTPIRIPPLTLEAQKYDTRQMCSKDRGMSQNVGAHRCPPDTQGPLTPGPNTT